MATVPVTRTWVAGEVVTAAHFNTNIRDVLQFLLAPPIFRGRQTSAQSIANITSVAITLDTEDFDTAGGHSTVSNTSRYTAVYPGYYQHSGGLSYSSDATGTRAAEWGKNGTLINGGSALLSAVNGNSTRLATRTDYTFLNVGDYLELFAFQNRGSALNTAVTNQEQSTMAVKWESN